MWNMVTSNTACGKLVVDAAFQDYNCIETAFAAPNEVKTRITQPGSTYMPQRKPIRAVFPGTFDPITHGHLDIIKRAVFLADELIIAVGHNPEKQALFSPEERVEMVRELTGDLKRVRVEAYQGLTGEFVKQVKADLIIRGIRDNVDLHYELQQANINLAIANIETAFLLTRDQFALTSSTYIKQIVELGYRDLDNLARIVPLPVAQRLLDKLAKTE